MEQSRMLLVAGPNGSGKTTVTERGLAHEWFTGCECINPDFIARDEFGDWNSPAAVMQAAKGRIVRQYHPVPAWMRPISDALEGS
jgi:predicted ABC-type ATPase